MKKLLFALAISLCGVMPVWADAIPTVVDSSTRATWEILVYNNSTSNLTSGSIVVWDTSSTSFTTSGYRYVTTTTTVDDIWTAGVLVDPTCNAGTMCHIVVYGPTTVICEDSSDAVGINTTVGTATTAGRCGDYTPAANKRSLGTAMGGGSGSDFQNIMIFVDTLGSPSEQ